MLTNIKLFNEKLLTKYKPTRLPNAIDIVMPGFVGGNDVLFVAQNPGLLKNTVPGDMNYLEAYKNGKHKLLNRYYVEALQSSRGTLGIFVNDIYDTNWDNISITNVLKCPFEHNIVPKIVPMVDRFILSKQIYFLKPKIIVGIGKIAQLTLDMINVDHMSVYHPSYLKRKNSYTEYVKQYKLDLEHRLNVFKN